MFLILKQDRPLRMQIGQIGMWLFLHMDAHKVLAQERPFFGINCAGTLGRRPGAVFFSCFR